MAIDVQPRPDVSPIDYDVTTKAEHLESAYFVVYPRTYRVVYQPGDSFRPEIVSCECGVLTTQRGRFSPCSHIAAVVAFRREAEG